VKAEADVIVDTTHLNIYELRNRVAELFADGERDDHRMQTTLLSFGYKHGLPTDVDIVLDCRFLPNPYWVDELRPLTGRDPAVVAHVLGEKAAQQFLDKLDALLDVLLPEYVSEGKAYLSIAFGCTGGRHRAVAIVEEVASRLRARGIEATVKHRDIDR
jgi:RNase adapter protein RapZ